MQAPNARNGGFFPFLSSRARERARAVSLTSGKIDRCVTVATVGGIAPHFAKRINFSRLLLLATMVSNSHEVLAFAGAGTCMRLRFSGAVAALAGGAGKYHRRGRGMNRGIT